MKILSIIGSYIKTHIITSAVIGTVLVGGTVTTPIIVNNVKDDNQPQQIEKVKEPGKVYEEKTIEREVQEDGTCEEGFELKDNKCIKIVKVKVSPESKKNKEKSEDKKVTNETKTENKEVNKPATVENKTENVCNDISYKVSMNNRVVYYNGQMLFGVQSTTFDFYSYYVDGWQYNRSLIASLSKEDRTYLLNNYYNKLNVKYDLKGDIRTYENVDIADYKRDIVRSDECINYLNNGVVPSSTEFHMANTSLELYCFLPGNGYEDPWTVGDWQNNKNSSSNYLSLYERAVQNMRNHLNAYQDTGNLLRN